jgi:deoxyribodipyrimidine photo-lyase
MFSYHTAAFIFRRDYRLVDNHGLNAALNQSQRVIACFIADPQQIQAHAYQSQPGLQFMLQSLVDLQQQLQTFDSQLAVYYASPEAAILQLFENQAIQAVFFNRDYTPFSRQRDAKIAQICQQLGIDCYSVADNLLNEPEHCLKKDQTPYKVFTAFYHNARQYPVALPQALPILQKRLLNIETGFDLQTLSVSIKQTVSGGRTQALALLKTLFQCADYQQQRDFPALNASSHLSAHLKFGTCSVREVYYAIVEQLGSEHPLIRQLYWRDFFTHLAYLFPQVFQGAFLKAFINLNWENNPHYFAAWTVGKTGFPIVDAGMRELNATGLMHNRVRMIVASFLVKDLHIDWRWGERYFAQHLMDYDPCINNGNWQWAASTGCDAQPYFRIFNPWLQQQKFDANCTYIYRWLPELKKFPPAIVHQWDKKYCQCAYPAPIVNHNLRSQLIKQRFKMANEIYWQENPNEHK